MSKRVVYVGGLSQAVSDEQLKTLFVPFGAVTRAWIIRHKHTGTSAGYGFVEMPSGDEARNAAVALQGSLVNGDCLRVYVTPYAS